MSMATREIIRRIEEDYFDYDGEEEMPDPEDDWDWEMFNESFNW